MVTDIQNTLMGTYSNFLPVGTALNTGGVNTYQGQFTYDLWGGQTSLPQDAIGNTLNIDPGPGKEVKVVIDVTTAITMGAGGTLQFQIVASDDVAESVNVTVLNQGRAWTQAQLAALNAATGLGIVERLVVPINTTRRFLGFQYVNAVAAITAGAILVYVVIDEPSGLPQQ